LRRVWLHSYANADGNRKSNFNSYGHGYSHSYTNADCHTNSDSHCNRDRDSHRHTDAMHGKMCTDAEAAPNSGATPVVLSHGD
jgi:hypothetical protein